MNSRRRQSTARSGSRHALRRSRTALPQRIAAAVLSLSVFVGIGAGWALRSDLTSGLYRSSALDALRDDAPSSSNGDTNILLIGLDSRKAMDGSDLPAEFVTDDLHAGDSEVGGYNTNTLILLHVPGDGSRASAVAIPRDDYVAVPGYGMRKIKEAYGLAKADAESRLIDSGVSDPAALEQQSREVGRRSTLTTVQNLLHVSIDHFAEVNLIGFYDIAAAIGPVEVCLNSPVRDSYSGADFPAGPQSLAPAQALSFVRQRHGLDNGDLDRTRRQQAFISGVIENLKSTGIIGNIPKMQALVAAVKNDIVIDSELDPIEFASRASNLSDGNLDFYTLPIEGYATVDGQSINTVDPARLRAEVSALFTTGSPVPPTTPAAAPIPAASGVIDIRNGSARDGVGAAVASSVRAQGYPVGSVTTAAHTPETRVTFGAGGAALADVLAGELGMTATADEAVEAGHVTVLLGTDDAQIVLPTTAPGVGDGTSPADSVGVPDSAPPTTPIRADAPNGTPCVD